MIIGGVTRVIPLTGVTLPFVSYGGSSLVANFVILALLLRISDETRARSRRARPRVAVEPARRRRRSDTGGAVNRGDPPRRARGASSSLLVLVAQLTYLQVVDANKLADDPRNVRAQLRDINRPRGEIVTADGEVVGQVGHVDRRAPTSSTSASTRSAPLFTQIVGYQSFVVGNTGVEKSYNDELVGRSLRPRSCRTSATSSRASTDTGTRRARRSTPRCSGSRRRRSATSAGSVVLLDVKTGGIVAMYSNPTFDPQPLAGPRHRRPSTRTSSCSTANPDKPDAAAARTASSTRRARRSRW